MKFKMYFLVTTTLLLACCPPTQVVQVYPPPVRFDPPQTNTLEIKPVIPVTSNEGLDRPIEYSYLNRMLMVSNGPMDEATASTFVAELSQELKSDGILDTSNDRPIRHVALVDTTSANYGICNGRMFEILIRAC